MSVRAVTAYVSDPNQRPDGVPEGCCWCGCGAWLAARRTNTRYADAKHRQAHHRERLHDAAEAVGVPSRLSFKTLGALDTGSATGKRRGDARKPRKPDLRVNYRRAVAAVEQALNDHGSPHAAIVALDALQDLLTDRQRTALRERRP